MTQFLVQGARGGSAEPHREAGNDSRRLELRAQRRCCALNEDGLGLLGTRGRAEAGWWSLPEMSLWERAREPWSPQGLILRVSANPLRCRRASPG